MERTQVYLTREQRRELKRLATVSGKRQSELIRAAIDAFVRHARELDWRSELLGAAGQWADRNDLPDFARFREELDRFDPGRS